MVNWLLPAAELIFEAFFWLTFIAYKPSQILPKTFPKPFENSIFFAIRSYHFFVLILHRCFANFLLISRPSKPEKSCSRAGGSTIFTKSTFSLRVQKSIKKSIEIWVQKSKKIWKKALKKRVCKHVRFWHRFLVIFGTILPPKLEAKIVDFSYFSLMFQSKLRSLLR